MQDGEEKHEDDKNKSENEIKPVDNLSAITEKKIEPREEQKKGLRWVFVEFGNQVRKWALITTIHGLSNLVRANSRWRQVFWIFMLFVCLVLCTLLVVNSIREYFEYDVVTKSRTLPLDDDSYFPIVLVCNENPFLSPDSQRLIVDHLRQAYGKMDDHQEDWNMTSFDDVIDKLGGIDNATSAFSKLLYLMSSKSWLRSLNRSTLGGYTAQDVFFEMEFSGDPINLNDLEPFLDPVYGPCFKFNSGKNASGHTIERQRMLSPAVQLTMSVLVGVSYELMNYLYEPKRKGILIEVKDPDGYPFMSKPALIGPSLYSEISLSKFHSQVNPYPYSDCVDTTQIANSNSKSEMLIKGLREIGINFKHEYCAELLIQMDTIEILGCYDVRLINVAPHNATPECPALDILTSRGKSIYSSDEIIDFCPLACDQVSYTLDISKQDFPTLGYYHEKIRAHAPYIERVFGVKNASDVSYEAFGESMTYVSIFFHDMTVSEMSEKPKTDAAALVANLGGIIGVFLGVSVLTLVEFIELVGHFVYILFKKK